MRHQFRKHTDTLAYIVIVFILVIAAYQLLTGSVRLKNALSIDQYSESNCLRGARAFVEEGMLRTVGLSRTAYGEEYPGYGHAHLPEASVYTHYPPGPEYLLTAYWMLFSEKNVPLFRIFNSLLVYGALVFLVYGFSFYLKPFALLVFTATLLLLPMTLNMSIGLHYQGIALGLLMAQIGVLLVAHKHQWKHIQTCGALFAISFIHGYLSFDYFFLVSFAPLTVLLFTQERLHSASLKAAFVHICSCMAGFGFAHFIHFIQVAVYMGSITEAIADLSSAAVNRSFEDRGDSYFAVLVKGIHRYVFDMPFDKRYGGILSWLWVCMGVLLVFLRRVIVRLPHTTFDIPNRAPLIVLSSYIISLMWVIVMPAHALIHEHFIPRHYFFTYCMTLATFCAVVSRSDLFHFFETHISLNRKSLVLSSLIIPYILIVVKSGELSPRNWATITVDEIKVHAIDQPWSVWQYARSAGGQPLQIAEKHYQKGIGSHATMDARISLPRGTTQFDGACGVQDGYPRGSIQCVILQGQDVLWQSDIARHGNTPQKFSVSLRHGERDVILRALPTEDGYIDDLVNWVDLQFR